MALENSEKAGKAIDNNQKEWGFFSTTIGKIVLFGGIVLVIWLILFNAPQGTF